jgi:signal peptidase I
MTQPNNLPPEDRDETPENPWIEGLKTIGLSAILALGIRQFVAEARFIPSGSMLPTLQIDDRLIVDKVSYKFSTPQRGDVVVFMPPYDSVLKCGTDPSKPVPTEVKDAFIKRVIGLPGEKVEVKDGKVLVNDQPLSENYTEEAASSPYAATVVPKDSYMVFGDNRNHSCDSRFWGVVPQQNMIGKAVVRFWPLNRMGGVSPKPPYQN